MTKDVSDSDRLNYSEILTPEKLLAPYARELNLIKELSGVAEVHFESFYLSAIKQMARFVQQLPASEVHHHAGPCGMLQHTLEVCVAALKRRRSYLLSDSGCAEDISQQQDCWTYAVFTAALCHDLAKPAVDQTVRVLPSLSASSSGLMESHVWSPWSTFMDEQGCYYNSRFVRNRSYRLHEKATLLLTHRILPAVGMDWLSQEKSVLSDWLDYLSTNGNASSLSEIITQADRESVARNLGAETVQAMSGGLVKPLYEKMLTALRYLLHEGKLPLNRDGAAGWIKDNACWLVSKRTVDAIREQLIAEGHTGIPTKNGRLFDILQEHGILIPFNDKAIWPVTIAGDNFQHEFTMIKFKVFTLWPEAEQRPDEFTGTITPATSVNLAGIPGETSAHKKADAEKNAVVSLNANDQSTSVKLAKDEETDAAVLEFLPTLTSSESVPHKSDRNSTEPTAPATRLQAAPPGKPELQQAIAESNGRAQQADKDPDEGNAFIEWVRKGLNTRAIPSNRPAARIHRVEEGVLLITPGIFQDYEKAHPGEDWKSVQKAFLKKQWHAKNAQGLNVVQYQVAGHQKQSKLIGILIPDATIIFGASKIPQPNPHLVKVIQPVK